MKWGVNLETKGSVISAIIVILGAICASLFLVFSSAAAWKGGWVEPVHSTKSCDSEYSDDVFCR